MPDKLIENSPAKINLFLKVINKRSDGYFNIRSGVTFVNLYDQVIAEQSKYFQIDYKGKFAPINGQFDNCIVEKLFNKMQITKPKYKFTIIKNIPTQSGLGSASSNVAAVVRILNKLKLIDYKSSNQYISIGSDVPLFINFHDCLIRGRGEKIINQIFPKYYFLIVKPNLSCSTKEMYLQISEIN